jgi:phage shock protein C
MVKKLYKSRTDSKLDGVCGGIAEYFNIDSTIVRLIWLVLCFTGTGIIAYILCAIVMPRAPLPAERYDAEDSYDNPNAN